MVSTVKGLSHENHLTFLPAQFSFCIRQTKVVHFLTSLFSLLVKSGKGQPLLVTDWIGMIISSFSWMTDISSGEELKWNAIMLYGIFNFLYFDRKTSVWFYVLPVVSFFFFFLVFSQSIATTLSFLMSLYFVLNSIAYIISLSIPLFHGEFNYLLGITVTFSFDVYSDFVTMFEVVWEHIYLFEYFKFNFSFYLFIFIIKTWR